MLGDGGSVKGLYLLAADDIFKMIANYELDAWISFYEIYCGKLYDLLNDKAILHARYSSRLHLDRTTKTT